MPKSRGNSQSSQQQVMDENALEIMINKVCVKFLKKIEEQFDKKFENLELKLNMLCDKYSALEKAVGKNENTLLEMNTRIDEIEQKQRKNTLRFVGIKESKGEHLMSTITNIVNTTLKVKCTTTDISNIYRVGKPSKEKSRTILVEFISYLKCNEIINARKLLKNSGLFINEDLTEQRYKLLQLAKKKYGVRNTWTRGGRLYVNQNGSIKLIQNDEDTSA